MLTVHVRDTGTQPTTYDRAPRHTFRSRYHRERMRERHPIGGTADTYLAHRRAIALSIRILRAQRREDASPIDGSDHPITCRRRCCR